jgi:hypothetical protein
MIRRRKNRGVTSEKQREAARRSRFLETPEQYARRRQMVRDAAKQRRLKDPLGEMLRNTERSANHRKIDFKIDRADLEPLPSHCPVLGIELRYDAGLPAGSPQLASIDRFLNHFGYIPGNVVIVSNLVNTRKGDLNSTELRKIAAFYSRWLMPVNDDCSPSALVGQNGLIA